VHINAEWATKNAHVRIVADLGLRID